MNTTTVISWQPVSGWPVPTSTPSNASNYVVWAGTNLTAPVTSTTGGATSVAVSYDDSLPGVIFIIRPVDDITNPTMYGPAQSVVIGQMSNRGWVRAHIRKSMADRSDVASGSVTLSDDELNAFINEAIRDYSVRFPHETDTTMAVNMTGDPETDRTYPLPADYYEIVQIRYSSPSTHFNIFLKPMEWKAGETMSSNWVGYSKLGLWQSPRGGRFYAGNYSVYEQKLVIDFDPTMADAVMHVRYKALYPYPTDDVTALTIPEADMELITLYAEAKAWLLIESKDVRLSRWRSKDDGGKRNDLPTEIISARLLHAYNTKISERRTLRTRPLRLVRRT